MRDPFAPPETVPWEQLPQAELKAYLDTYRLNRANHPRASVPFSALTDDAVISPPRQLYHVTGGQDEANFGSTLTPNGVYQAFGSSWGYWRGESLPAQVGFRREYRLAHQLGYNIGAVGTTAANWFIKISGITSAMVFLDPGAPYNASRDISSVGPWGSSPELETLANGHYFVQWLGNVAGAVYTVAMRDVVIEGRYVRL